MHRKLIRPSLAVKRKGQNSLDNNAVVEEDPPVRHRSGPPRSSSRRPGPPEQTSAEEFYYVKQMNAGTPLVFVLDNGAQVRGRVEWYDKLCLQVVPDDGGARIMVFKHSIRYLYKQEEEDQ